MAKKPLVALVGRPNVGKSTLFNRLVGERRAIVEDVPGTTRDRHYADVEWGGHVFTLVDTGGLVLNPEDEITEAVRAQAQLAIDEADVIVFLTDVMDGLLGPDAEIADLLLFVDDMNVLDALELDDVADDGNVFDFSIFV